MVFFDFWSAIMGMMSSISNNNIYGIIVTLSSLYGVQIVLFVTLGAITIYRREMSCNHCYHPVTVQVAAGGGAAAAAATSAAADAAAPLNHPQGEEQQEVSESANKTETSSTRRASSPLLLRTLTSTSCCSAASTSTAFCHDEDVVDHHHGGGGETDSGCSAGNDRHAGDHAGGAVENNAHHAPLVGGRLPPDVLVHILAYLSPRDVISFGCTCHAARIVVHGNNNNMNNLKAAHDSVDSDATMTTAAAATSTKMTTTAMLWKTLWRRDYAWIIESWIIGRQAVQRTSTTIVPPQNASSSLSEQQQQSEYLANVTFDLNFYFRFAASWMNFVLAGRNCVQNGCYVGLSGHVYDMTTFVLIHPGSPETVLVQAGRDATAFFVNVRHSAGALKLAKSMCIVVDQSRIISLPSQPGDDNEHNNNDTLSSSSSSSTIASEKVSSCTTTASSASCGLRPTRHLRRLGGSPLLRKQQQEQQLPKEQCMIPELSLSNMSSRQRGNNSSNMLQRIQMLHDMEEAQALQGAKQKYATTLRLTDVNVFYNPFLQTWQAWYTNPNMETVFCNVE